MTSARNRAREAAHRAIGMRPYAYLAADAASGVWAPLLLEALSLGFSDHTDDGEYPGCEKCDFVRKLSDLGVALRGPEDTDTAPEAPSATEANGEATDGPWEYQLLVKKGSGTIGNPNEPFTYGPYPTEDCGGLLAALTDRPTWDWKLQRRRPSDWVDYKKGQASK